MFNGGYDLGLRDLSADTARAVAYANLVEDLLGQWRPNDCKPDSVVEFGSATGALLLELARRWGVERATGVEPAPQLLATARREISPNVDFRQGFAEQFGSPPKPFALCISVNVVEHAVDPVEFLLACRRAIAEDGWVLTICPDGETANVELLFLDHFSSFSTDSLSIAGSRAGLELLHSKVLADGHSGFRASLFGPVGSLPLRRPADHTVLANDREAYLGAWGRLENDVIAGLEDRPFAVFGAGEFAELLAAYAPRVIERAIAFVEDQPPRRKHAGRPLLSTSAYVGSHSETLLAAVHPRSWSKLQRRLGSFDVPVVHPYQFSELRMALQ